MHNDISFHSIEFQAVKNNDLDFVSDNFDLYDALKDYWLNIASCYSDLTMNEFFISKGANPHFHGTQNFTNAIFQNNLEVVKLFVSHHCILLGEDDCHLGGAIMNAVTHDNLEMLIYLISIGCDIHLDSDYAFNRGIAENSIQCIQYLHNNYLMSYDPTNDYNIQQIIENNHYQIFNDILNTLEKPLSFDFKKIIQTLFTKGHPEVFDVFVHHQLMNESLFLDNFYFIFYYFPYQQHLYHHIMSQYSHWFSEACSQHVEDYSIQSLLEFVVSQKYFINNQHMSLSIEDLEIIEKTPFINKFISSHPYCIPKILISNISQQNNMALLSYKFKPNYIDSHSIQSLLDKFLPNFIDNELFPCLLSIIFKKPFFSQFKNLNNIYSYYKINLLLSEKNTLTLPSTIHKI